jgi:hypothetical protein
MTRAEEESSMLQKFSLLKERNRKLFQTNIDEERHSQSCEDLRFKPFKIEGLFGEIEG